MPYFSIAVWMVVLQQHISAKTFAIIYAANTMQSSLDAIVILGFVRPYRNFVLRFFKNSFKKGWKKLVSGQDSQQIFTTNQISNQLFVQRNAA
uniref:Uncharacterized protein n=1 Tax=Acrobeloides nanus TaxID=290746 RepID=A0A914EAM3_9BILA